MSDRARVLIVDPHEAYRRALAHIVTDGDGDLALLDEVSGSAEAEWLAREASPDVILVCVAGRAGYGLIQRLRDCAPRAAVVVTSFADDAESVAEAFRAGASGFLPKHAPPDEVLDALVKAAKGEVAINPALAGPAVVWAAQRLAEGAAREVALAKLTLREHDILSLLADGNRPAAIAERLFLSRRTVEGHLANIYRKLGVGSGLEAVREFLRARETS